MLLLGLGLVLLLQTFENWRLRASLLLFHLILFLQCLLLLLE